MPDCVYYDFHPPHEVRAFDVPAASIRRWDDAVFVYEARIGDLVLRHYAFAERWFVVNCTLDLDGGFVVESGPLAYTFNCDIATPVFNVGTTLHSVDLSLDVLVAPDGKTHLLIDEDEFAEHCRNGWLTPAEQHGARRGLHDLLAIVRGEGLVAFLDRLVPFGAVRAVPPSPRTTLDVAAVPVFDAARRGAHYGHLVPVLG